MPFARSYLVLLTLVALLLQGLVAHPVSARQCLRVQASEYCVEMSNPVAKFADHTAPAPALLPAEALQDHPEATKSIFAQTALMGGAQTDAGPQRRPPRL